MIWPIRSVAGELTYDVERVVESACEAAAGSSRNPRCSVAASVLAPHVVKLGAALLLSASTATAATWPGTQPGYAWVFLHYERCGAAAHAAVRLRPVRLLHEVLLCAVVTATYACRKSGGRYGSLDCACIAPS